ncbi:hypothetical protein ACHQM5_003851 [Ranunculus cassubicifolius]
MNTRKFIRTVAHRGRNDGPQIIDINTNMIVIGVIKLGAENGIELHSKDMIG